MEEKKVDKGSIFGFIIIGLILVWMLYNNSNQKASDESKKEVVTSEVAVPSEIDSPPEKPEVTKNYKPQDSIKGKIISFENELIALKINTKGGQLTEVKLKSFEKYDGEPIFLIKDNNANFNISLQSKDGNYIETKDLLFESQIDKQDGQQVLKLYTSLETGKNISFIYRLKPNDYLVDFNIQSEGFSNLLDSSKEAKMQWQMKGFSHAKSVSYENRYSMLTYKYGEDTSELSASKDDDDNEENIHWISYRQHFFNSILISDKVFSSAKLSSVDLLEKTSEDITPFTKDFNAIINLDLANGELSESLHWYFGPTDYDTLSRYKKYDLSSSMYLGWGIFGWLNKYVFIPLFNFLCSWVPHGIAIILLTIIVRILMSPATYKSYLSQAKMKVIQPEIAEINKKFEGKDKAMKRQQETMALYRKAGVNPMSGCIPSLLQLPVFYALFTFFPTAFALRQKRFLWAEDLSSYDTIFELPFSIPFYGSHVSLFPILASVAIFFYMRLTTSQTTTTQQPGMPNMKFLMYLSPVMMLFFFNNYASGLSLYYFISNLITIIIMLVIKNFILDQDKIHARIQENKKKPKQTNRFQRKMQEMMEQAEERKKQNKK